MDERQERRVGYSYGRNKLFVHFNPRCLIEIKSDDPDWNIRGRIIGLPIPDDEHIYVDDVDGSEKKFLAQNLMDALLEGRVTLIQHSISSEYASMLDMMHKGLKIEWPDGCYVQGVSGESGNYIRTGSAYGWMGKWNMTGGGIEDALREIDNMRFDNWKYEFDPKANPDHWG